MLVVAMLVISSAASAECQHPCHPPAHAHAGKANLGARKHDGFFLRMMAGAGYADLRSENAGTNVEMTGTAMLGTIEIGGSVSDHVVVFGTASAIALQKPRFKQGGAQLVDDERETTVVSIGGGAGYYFDNNVFISGALLLPRILLRDAVFDTREITDAGLGFYVAGGKEWWVSDNWGLGIAGQFHFSRLRERGNLATEPWNVLGFGVAFSATYN